MITPSDPSGTACVSTALAASRSAIASGVRDGPTSATRTRTPRLASSAATTHASPPLLPGPAYTATPCDDSSGKRLNTRPAAARPAACISERDGTPPAIAAASSSAACDALTTRTLIAAWSSDPRYAAGATFHG